MKEDTRSDEQKAADKDRMAKVRAARKPEEKITIDKATLDKLVAEAVAAHVEKTPEQGLKQSGAVVGDKGVQGVQYKWAVDKDYYPDPTDGLYDLPELKRFALRDNFDLRFDVEGVMYESHGVTYAEPRFTVELWSKQYQDGVEVGKALVQRGIWHEDPLAARTAMSKLGKKEADFGSFEEMLEQMRFHRMRQWMLSLFNPTRPAARRSKTTKLVGNKVVEFEDREELISGPTPTQVG